MKAVVYAGLREHAEIEIKTNEFILVLSVKLIVFLIILYYSWYTDYYVATDYNVKFINSYC